MPRGRTSPPPPADLESVSPYAREAVLKLWRQNLLNGDGVNFNPLRGATRAQAATVCWRLDQAVETWYREPGEPSQRVKLDPATGLPYGEQPGAPAETKPSGGSSGDSGSSSGGSGSSGSSGGSGGNSGTTTPTDSWSVSFYDGSRLIKRFNVKKGEPLGQLPTVAESSRANCILEGYYTDPGFTTPFYAENPVTGNTSVYARYESMGEPEALTLDSFARMDQQPGVSFRFRALEGASGTPEAAVTLLVKDGTDPVRIEVSGSGGIYTVYAPDGFNEGCSYELKLAEGWSFLPDGSDTIDSDAIRTAAFSIEMAEVEDLSMNSEIRYVQDTGEIDYTYTDQDGRSHSAAFLPSDADISGGGSFNYSGDTTNWQNGDILCIYVGARPDDGDENTRTEEAIYAKVSSLDGGAVEFVPLKAEDQSRLYDIPDNFPIQVDALPAGADGTVSIDRLDETLYARMVGADRGTLDNARAALSVGDFVSLYVDSASIFSESDVYFGRITAVSGDSLTFAQCTAADIEDSANLYKSVDVENTDMVTPAEQAEIQRIVQSQVEQSDFAEEAAYYLADMATRTEGFRTSAGLLDFTATGADGEAVSEARLVSYAGLMELDGDDDEAVDVKVSVVTDADKLHFGRKGVQLAVQVDAKFKVDAEDGAVHFDLSATFVQEAAIDPRIRGELVTKKILFIPVPTGVQVNAIVDVRSYTAMSLRADIYTVAEEDKPLWESFKDFTKDPSVLANIPGLPAGLTDGIKTVGEAIDKIEDTKAKIDEGLEDVNKLQSDLEALWSVVEASQGGMTRAEYEQACETLGQTNVAGELMELLHLSEDEISAEYVNGLDELMDQYSELLEKETDWVQLVNEEMLNSHTPPEYGIMVGIQANFVVRADLNIALGSNLEYEVGKRYNFWFRVGLFRPTSGSSTMDLIDEHFAFQFYVMGKLGLKAGVRVKLYAAIGSVDAISVGLTTELGPYVKLWGFFIYDYSKYRPANTQNWARKEQMAGALYLEFGLYLMVGMEAKALFLEYDHDFVDEEFPLLDAGNRLYYYGAAYEPLDDEDELVVYNDGSAALQEGCAVSMLLPEDTYALKCMDLTTGKQSARSLSFDDYIFQVSNPNFRVDNVGGKPVISVISIPQNVRLMQCDLTITYRHGKLAFSTFDMSTTVHLAWTNMTAAEYQQVYTASVTVPDGEGGREVIWSQRVRKGTPFNLPTDDEIKALLSWSDAKYIAGSGYGSQPTEGVTLIENTQYHYDLGYQTYRLTVTGIQGGSGSRTFTGKYGEPFDLSSLTDTGTDGPNEYTRFAGLMMDGQTLALNQPIDGRFAASKNATATAQYADETVTATFQFTGTDHADIEVTLRRGDTPDTSSVLAAVPSGLTVSGFYPAVGPLDGDMTYQVVCEAPRGNAVTVTFNANGGDAVAPVTRTVGAVLGALPTPTRTGYGFDGWFTDDGTFANQVDANTVVPEGGMTLYAKWTQGSVTVTFNTNGGVNLTENIKTVAYGQAYGELPTPERSGYGFLGWFTAADDTGTQVTASTTVDTTEAHTLYAHWVELKTIPSSVFNFGAQETATYDKNSHTATYTFTAETGETYTEDSFKIEYTRLSDDFRNDNTNEGAAPVTAGYYIAHITRPADDTYAKFDQTYGSTATDAVLHIERATRDLSGITNDDIILGEQGLTYQKVSLPDGMVDDLGSDVYITYTVKEYKKGNIVSSSSTRYYIYDNKEVESGLLYDLSRSADEITLTEVGVIGDINYEDASQNLTVPLSVKTTSESWSSHADTSWYNETDTTFEISTPAQLAGLASLVRTKEGFYDNSKYNFAGKTVKLTNDLDLSQYSWSSIGYTYMSGLFTYVVGFKGTFDGGGHTIKGVSDDLFGAFGSGTTNSGDPYPFTVEIRNLTLEDCRGYFAYCNLAEGTGESQAKIVNCVNNATERQTIFSSDRSNGQPKPECTGRPERKSLGTVS